MSEPKPPGIPDHWIKPFGEADWRSPWSDPPPTFDPRDFGDPPPPPERVKWNWFPAVDIWFVKTFGKKTLLALIVLGALTGYGYGLDAAPANAHWYAVIGGMCGLLLLPLLWFGVKIVLTAAVVGLVGLLGYVAYRLYQLFGN